ncbi:TetR/AcrR family transcriptional regulator [Amycolatopsis sp. NBC_01488]|uniref:TetR/AcrR family transcriptional regulator n=1 Tax=Amycolatopsis sp. NBC_01488 TaxID=2903563 RepID=UPI002E2A7C51|nr:TetR/AcrR family transcriptional regulator [Amycolatopsis sp. NBC_01488]
MTSRRGTAPGLTYRAVDPEAGVPPGTTSNYFRDRDQLLAEAGARVHVRLSAPEEVMADPRAEEPSAGRVAALLGDVMKRLTTRRSSYLALLELRLEANRRPGLAAALTATVRDSFDLSVGFHEAAGLPGGRDEVLLLYLALTGLTVERLTLPEAFAGYSDAQVVGLLVDRILAGE